MSDSIESQWIQAQCSPDLPVLEVEMKQRNFFLITSILFALIAFLHAVRLLLGWQVSVGGAVVPIWASWIGLAIAAFLAYEGFRLSKTPTK